MIFYTLSHKGEFHVNHNEDFLVLEDCGQHTTMMAVMDGCSSGSDSHFAATLMGKVLRKIAKQEAYREYAKQESKGINQLLEDIALQLFEELSNLHRQLDLRSDELLATLMLAVVNTSTSKGEVLVVGDGLLHVNGENFEYENDNKPDYLGYHLNMDKHLWYATKTSKKSIQKIEDMTIATDGIHTFKNFDGQIYDGISEEDIMSLFFSDKSDLDIENKLKKTLIKIKNNYGLMPSDDLTMIRAINQEK